MSASYTLDAIVMLSSKVDMDTRAKAIERLGSMCSRCGEKDKRFLDIIKVDDALPMRRRELYAMIVNGDEHNAMLVCGNCKNMKKWHRELFDTVSPKGRMTKFDIDLSYGKEREHSFASMLGSKIEVKSDRQARKTGNVYVEYESRGKPGGIEATDADFWAQEVDDDVFIVMPVERLRKIVNRRLDKYGATLGGDGKTSKGALVRVTELVKPVQED